MNDLKRVYWSVDTCGWVACPPPLEPTDVPKQRTEEPEPAVLAES